MATNENEKKPLLNLSTEKHIGHINIDGKAYGLIRTGSLGVKQRAELTSLGTKLSKSSQVETVKGEKQWGDTLSGILGLVMPSASKNVISKLSVLDRLAAVQSYMDVAGLSTKKVTPLTKGPKAKKKKR